MTGSLLTLLLRQLRGSRPDERPDAELLARLAGRRDPDALQALMARHAPLVLGVCRRLLPGRADADDVFQATFLILARRAPSLRPTGSLGSWLHTVAYRLALKARAECRSAPLELECEPLGGRDPLDEISGRELCAIIDEELQRLPEKYRAPILLCCLEGKSREEAAAELGWPEGAVKGRLQRGRELLRRRLARRGLDLGTVLLVPLLTQQRAPAAVLPPAETLLTGGGAALSSGAVRLAEAAMPALFGGPRPLLALAVLLALVAASAGLAWAALRPGGGDPPPTAARRADPPAAPGKAQARQADADPLPQGAAFRLGSLRLWHEGYSSPVCFGRDGKTLLTRGGDAFLREWDVATGRELSAVKRPMDGPGGLSPDGKLAWTLLRDGVAIVEVRTGKEVRRFNQWGVNGLVRFTPDGKTLVFQVWDGKTLHGQLGDIRLRFYDVATGKKLRDFPAPLASQPPSVSADGKWFAHLVADSPHPSTRLLVCDAATGKDRFRTERLGGVEQFGFSPDGRHLAATVATVYAEDNKWVEGGVFLWDATTGKLRHRLQLRPREGLCFAFSPGAKLLAVGAYTLRGPPQEDMRIRLFDPASGKEIRAIRTPQITSGPLLFSPDGKLLAVGTTRGPLRLYDVATGADVGPTQGHAGEVTWCGFAPDGRTLASLGTDQTLRLWEAGSGRLLATTAVVRRQREEFRFPHIAAFTPDGKTVVSTTDDFYLHTFDAKTLRPLASWTVGSTYAHPAPLAYSPDGKVLATASIGAQLLVWDPATQKRVRLIGERRSGQIHDFAFTRSGKQVAILFSGSHEPDRRGAFVELWDTATGKEVWTKKTKIAYPYTLTVSADGRLLAAGGRLDARLAATRERHGPVEVYELATGEVLLERSGPNRQDLTGLDFSPDGRLLAGVSRDRWLWVYDVARGEEVLRTQDHRAGLSAVCFAPDGRSLATASHDTTMLIWRVPAGANPKPAAVTQDELRAAWQQLAEKGPGAKTLAAVQTLVAGGAQTLALLREMHARPALATPEGLKRLVAGLTDARFKVRQKASAELERLDAWAEQALRQALKEDVTEEARRRIDVALGRLAPVDGPQPRGERLRAWRSVWVVERIGTAEARALLAEWAERPAGLRLAAEARAALRRLVK